MKYYTYKYKYQLAETLAVELHDKFPDAEAKWCSVKDGVLIIAENYAWDGASGPVVNTENTLKATLVHDGLYQLMRLGKLPRSCRKAADKEMKQIMIENGCSKHRANLWYVCVRLFGAHFAKKIQKRDVEKTC